MCCVFSSLPEKLAHPGFSFFHGLKTSERGMKDLSCRARWYCAVDELPQNRRDKELIRNLG